MTESEVKNGQFVYRDTLFAEVGEGRRHPRASVADLKELLLPGKKNAPSKDQVGHWYEAQLIHYGLPRSKDKNTAKVRLTSALSSNSLVVPANVQKIESDLKKEYSALIRKAKFAATKTKAAPTVTAITGKKRKAENDNHSDAPGVSKTKVSVKVGDVTIDIDRQNLSKNVKSTKKQKVKSTSSSARAALGPKSEKKAKTTKEASSSGTTSTIKNDSRDLIAKIKHKVDGIPCYGPAATSVNQWQCDACKTQSHDSFHSAAKKSSSISTSASASSRPSRAKQTARRGKPFGNFTDRTTSVHSPLSQRQPTPMSIDSRHSDHEPPPPYSYNDDYHGPDHEWSRETDERDVLISGNYMIDLSGSFERTDLEVRLSYDRDQLWGTLDVGSKYTIVRLDGVEGIEASVRKTFGWRSEDNETGLLRFGKGCDGWIQFDGEGGVWGCFHNFDRGEDVEFQGQFEYMLDDEDDIDEPASRWHDFPRRAYGG